MSHVAREILLDDVADVAGAVPPNQAPAGNLPRWCPLASKSHPVIDHLVPLGTAAPFNAILALARTLGDRRDMHLSSRNFGCSFTDQMARQECTLVVRTSVVFETKLHALAPEK